MPNDPAHDDIALLLDANCLVYYCLRFDEHFQNTLLNLYHPLSDYVLQTIAPVIHAGRFVGSTSAVLSEIPDKGAEELVDDFLYNSHIRGILTGIGIDTVPPRVVGRWQDAFMRKFKKLRSKEWFREIAFMPSETELEGAKAFYRSLAGKATMADHIARKGKDCPSNEDLGLAIYARQIGVPLLSNDGDFTKFVEDWARFGTTVNPLVVI